MSERLPRLKAAFNEEKISHVVLIFDNAPTEAQFRELVDHVKLKFAGQLRRDPTAKQTPPPPPEAGD